MKLVTTFASMFSDTHCLAALGTPSTARQDDPANDRAGSTASGIRPDVLLDVDDTLRHINYHRRKPDMIIVNAACPSAAEHNRYRTLQTVHTAVATVQM